MRKILLLIIIALTFSCSNKELKSKQETFVTKIEQLEKENKILKERNKNLNSELQFLNEKINSLSKEYQDLKIEFSPAGICMEETAPDGTDYKTWFFSNGKFVEEMLFNVLVGDWQMSNDTLILNYKKKVGKRGIGEPIPLDGAMPNNYVNEYEEYVDMVEYVKKQLRYSWQYMKNEFKTKEVFRIVTKEVNENLIHKYDVELPGKYPFASSCLLTDSILDNYDKSELRLIRNEIFARYNYSFKDSKLLDHFSKFEWYTPKHENVDRFLSYIEKKNIKLIKEIEEK